MSEDVHKILKRIYHVCEYIFSATSLMLSCHRDHPLREFWIGLFINHVRDVKGGLRTYWGTNNNLSITTSIGRIIKIEVAG